MTHICMHVKNITYLNKAIMKMKPDEAGTDTGIGEGSICDDFRHNIA